MTNRAISLPWKEAEGTKADKRHYSHELSQHGRALGGHTESQNGLDWARLGWVELERTFKGHRVQSPLLWPSITAHQVGSFGSPPGKWGRGMSQYRAVSHAGRGGRGPLLPISGGWKRNLHFADLGYTMLIQVWPLQRLETPLYIFLLTLGQD